MHGELQSFIFSTSGSPMAESKPAHTNTKSGQNWNKESQAEDESHQRHQSACQQSVIFPASPHKPPGGGDDRRLTGSHCSAFPPDSNTTGLLYIQTNSYTQQGQLIKLLVLPGGHTENYLKCVKL